MNGAHTHRPSEATRASHWSGAAKIAFAGFVLVALFFLLSEHRAHLFGLLPFLLLAACPVLHFFHHGGHGDNEGEPPPAGPGERPPARAAEAPEHSGHHATGDRDGSK